MKTLKMLNILSILSVIIVCISLVLQISLGTTAFASRNSQGFVIPGLGLVDLGEFRKAPIAISGDNIYISWQSNNTANGNDEVNFRASTDGGATFGDKLNLSNSTDADSQDVEIAAGADNVIVTWWERNETSNEPVVRISSDNGASFGPLLRLATNGTLGQASQQE